MDILQRVGFACQIQRGIRSYTAVNLISTLIFITHFLIGHSEAAPTKHYDDTSRTESSDADAGSDQFHYLGVIVVSLGLLLTFIMFVMLCSGSCCLNVFGKRRGGETIETRGFDNPIANSTSISPIDVRALAMDPVVFEPLPSINELGPPSSNYYNTPHTWQHFRSPSSHYAGVVNTAIVPTDETNVYAHDWFDEPYRNFPRGNIVFEKEVGKAWFGKVIEAEAEDIVPYTKKLSVIVKVLREDATGTEQMRFLDESRLYRDVNHGNVLRLLGHSIETLPFLLIMEHCPQGDLKSFLMANVGRAELLNAQGALLRMALDVAKGLEGMVSANFIHKDLAARNCQVGSEGRVIIGDYGTQAQMFCDDYYWGSNVAIPLRWSAPETLHCTINTIQTLKVLKSSNVWTFGVVMWEICEFGKLPYFELTDDDVLSRVITEKNYTLGLPSRAGLIMKDQLYKIMLSCWNPQAENRPTINTIVEQLESLYNNMKTTISPVTSPTLSQHGTTTIISGLKSSTDDFDKKWDEFGSRGNAPNDNMTQNNEEDSTLSVSWKHDNKLAGNILSKKKSVSFVGMDDDDIPLVQIKSSSQPSEETQSNLPINFDNPESSLEKTPNSVASSSSNYYQSESQCQVLPFIVTASNTSTTTVDEPELKLKTDNLFSNSLSTDGLLDMDSSKGDLSPDPDDETTWRQSVEQGEISKKVREKSQSVQDLMILTRIEPSDLSDPDSLVIVSDSLVKKYGSGSALESPLNVSPFNFNLSSNETTTTTTTNGGGNSLRKSNSETALNSFSLLSTSSPASSIIQSNGVCNNTLSSGSQISGEGDTVVHNNVIISDSHTKNGVILTQNLNNSLDISNSIDTSLVSDGTTSLIIDKESN